MIAKINKAAKICIFGYLKVFDVAIACLGRGAIALLRDAVYSSRAT
ncbi:MAG: hypothetical protein KME31_25205 [Tolypothrix carrinoi HA7290-LM1]|nr:hypothetical protein [Tolypothrix carrinoi HA7290-LM1]